MQSFVCLVWLFGDRSPQPQSGGATGMCEHAYLGPGVLDSGLIFVLNKTYMPKTVMHIDDYDSLWRRDMRRYELV